MLFALDISTRCIGWTVLNNGILHDIGYIDLEKEETELEKVEKVLESFRTIKKSCDIKKIYVERALMGSNNAFTVAILQSWNGIVRGLLYLVFNVWPETVPEASVRKRLGLVLPKGVKGEQKKVWMLEHLLKQNIFPQDKVKFRKTGKYKKYLYDMADSLALALAQI